MLLMAGKCQSGHLVGARLLRAARRLRPVRRALRPPRHGAVEVVAGRRADVHRGRPVADPLGLLDAFGAGSAHLVGFSMGGGIAQAIAIRSPGPGALAHPDVDVAGGRPGRPASADARVHVSGRGAGAGLDGPGRGRGLPGGHRAAVRRGPLRRGARTPPRRARRRRVPTTRPRCSATTRSPAKAPTSKPGSTRSPRRPWCSTAPPTRCSRGATPRRCRDRIAGARLVALEGVGHELPPPALWDLVVAEIVRNTA